MSYELAYCLARHSDLRPCNGLGTSSSTYPTAWFLAELKQGRLPWVQPWGLSGHALVGVPRNALSQRPYRGVNILILWKAAIDRGYIDHRWLTFQQARAVGGTVRRGERGIAACFLAGPAFEKPNWRPDGPKGEAPRDEVMRCTLFNIAQCDVLPPRFSAPLITRASCGERMGLEEIVARCGLEIRIGGSQAFYSLDGDYLQLPPRPSFSGADSFCRAICHELIHATGHISRVSRPCVASTSSVNFEREELVAEMGGAFLCAMIGVNPVARHPELIGSWFALCQNDESELFRASGQASEAVAWILGRINA